MKCLHARNDDAVCRVLCAVCLMLGAGCSVLRNAHTEQENVRGKSMEAAEIPSRGRVDFRAYALADLVAYAQTNRPSVVQARLSLEDARLALKTIAADAPLISETPWTSPKLNLSGGYNEASAGTTIARDGWQTKGNASAALSLDLLLWDFGRNSAQIKAQSERVVSAERTLTEAGYEVFLEVARTYFNFYQNRALLEVALVNEQQYAERLQQAEERTRAGEAYRLDVLRARLDLATARQSVVAASNDVATAGAALMCALGVDVSQGTWESAFGAERTDMELSRKAFDRTHYGVDDAFDFARTNAPSLRVERAKLRAASHDVDYAIADLYPSVSASANLGWADPLWAWSWGVSAAQRVFDGFRRVTAVDRAVIALKTASSAVDSAEQALSVSLETAIVNRDNAVSALSSARASVRSADENLKTLREQLSVGSVDRIEVTAAISAYSSARGDSVVAFYDAQRAEAALFALMGTYPRYHEERIKVWP